MKYQSAFVFIPIIALFLGISYFSSAISSEAPGCIKCHTDEQVLKNLYKPPKIDISEGEG